jgi:acetyl-CoA C-acetyltransferase
MLETAENLRREYGISCGEQDELALVSHQRAVAAQRSGVFAEEIVPVTVRTRGGEAVIDTDEHPSADTSLEALARLRPVLGEQDPEATVTAGNASGQNDAAAVCVVTHTGRAEALGCGPLSASCRGRFPVCSRRRWVSGPSPRAAPRWSVPG